MRGYCGGMLLFLVSTASLSIAATPAARVEALQGRVVADRTDAPLSAVPGDPVRGKQIFSAREGGHCILCHSAPGVQPAGNIGPPLAGVGTRLTAAQLRFRVVDITRLNPDAAMPAFHRTQNLQRVAKEHADRPILSAQQVEDIVAYLVSLK